MSTAPVHLEFKRPLPNKDDTVAILSLNRPEVANAFHGSMIGALDSSLRQVEATASCRLVLLQGKGAHFSAGADLAWMKEAASLSYEENLREARRMAAMFERLYRLSIPTIAVVKGAAFGGALGLTACCDFAIASESSQFCLSEVKLGLLPAVILPYLSRKISQGQLKRLSLTATVFRGQEAAALGLVELCCRDDELPARVSEVVRAILRAGPEAQKAVKKLFFNLEDFHPKQDHITAEAIAKARSGQEGQEGLAAFFAKTAPSWSCKVPDEWKVDL